MPGIRGLDGLPGPKGITGEKGLRGLPGEPGRQGNSGPPGFSGLKGDVGPPGPSGRPGTSGLPGSVGSKGRDGTRVLIIWNFLGTVSYQIYFRVPLECQVEWEIEDNLVMLGSLDHLEEMDHLDRMVMLVKKELQACQDWVGQEKVEKKATEDSLD